jgi:integrase
MDSSRPKMTAVDDSRGPRRGPREDEPSVTGSKPKKRRIRSPHPGVKLKRRELPGGGVSWRGAYIDPDTGRAVYITLKPENSKTAEHRRTWAIAKSKSLGARRGELDRGGDRVQGAELEQAIKSYLETADARLRGVTARTYKLTLARFAAWARRHGVKDTTDLNRAKLSAYRDHAIRLPKHGVKKGSKRGEQSEVAPRRSPLAVNRDLRPVKTLVNAWRAAGMVKLDRDAISDGLKLLPVSIEAPAWLPPAKLAKLLEACLRHDAGRFEATREEHQGKRPKGTTPRYEPIAAFAALLLLTGMRRGEALALKWNDVDLTALDAAGTAVGEIRLSADATKTKRARTIGLEVSPGLKAMLAALKLRAGKGAVYVFERSEPTSRPADQRKHEPYTEQLIEASRRRLTAKGAKGFGAPAFDWQTLRSSCATYLTNAPGIFGAATVFLSARQLGHSVAVAEKHYLNAFRGIPREARTLDAAMQLEGVLAEVLKAVENAPQVRAVSR